MDHEQTLGFGRASESYLVASACSMLAVVWEGGAMHLYTTLPLI